MTDRARRTAELLEECRSAERACERAEQVAIQAEVTAASVDRMADVAEDVAVRARRAVDSANARYRLHVARLERADT
jgi:hypothetical protein